MPKIKQSADLIKRFFYTRLAITIIFIIPLIGALWSGSGIKTIVMSIVVVLSAISTIFYYFQYFKKIKGKEFLEIEYNFKKIFISNIVFAIVILFAVVMYILVWINVW